MMRQYVFVVLELIASLRSEIARNFYGIVLLPLLTLFCYDTSC